MAAIPKVVVTFKSSEMELYNKIKEYSSPAAFLKDCAIEHFKRNQAVSTHPTYIQDDIDVI